jgi:hypothetical protein
MTGRDGRMALCPHDTLPGSPRQDRSKKGLKTICSCGSRVVFGQVAMSYGATVPAYGDDYEGEPLMTADARAPQQR